MKTAEQLCYWLKVNIAEDCIAKDTYYQASLHGMYFYHVPRLMWQYKFSFNVNRAWMINLDPMDSIISLV